MTDVRNSERDQSEAAEVPEPGVEAVTDDRLQAVLQFLRGRRGAAVSGTTTDADWEDFHAMVRSFTLTILMDGNVPEQDRAACVQEIWREVISRLPEWRGPVSLGSFMSWLKKVAQTKVADWHREHARQRRRLGATVDLAEARLYDRHRDPAAEAEHAEELEIVRQGLSLLREAASTSTISVIEARYIEGKSILEICNLTGTSPQQVYDRERRGLEKLRSICRKLLRKSNWK